MLVLNMKSHAVNASDTTHNAISKSHRRALAILSILLLCLPSTSSLATNEIGDDLYISANSAELLVDAPRDVFITGFSAELGSRVSTDAHLAGMSVEVSGDIGGDLYAVGASVDISGQVADDLSVSGFAVDVADSATVGGNARINGGAVSIAGVFNGSLIAAGGTLEFNADVSRDVQLSALEIEFGEGARIAGTLTYSSAHPMEIPDSVVDPTRVRFIQSEGSELINEAREALDDSMEGVWPDTVTKSLVTFLVLLALLFLATLFLTFASDRVEQMRAETARHGWRSVIYGLLGLSTAIGLLPVITITLIGIPLLPLVVLILLGMWIMGYLLGVYTITMRICQALEGSATTVPTRLLVLSAGLFTIPVLNFIPFVGWLVNFTVLLLGFGALTFVIMRWLVSRSNTQKSLPAN